MQVANYYAVLHVPENADPAAIRHAYRILVRRFHPDAGIGSSAQKFRDVTEAYDVLSDPERRREHDIDLARSRTHAHVRPEPLIPETPRQASFRPSPFGVDREIDRMFRLFEDMFEEMW
ncbi:MAG TPA: J domain-containing protein [Candidatus Sulfotelmatobacter sp.]|nr:J domain-containing protein [Candidatus Sulfotelmatobacter sp.]